MNSVLSYYMYCHPMKAKINNPLITSSETLICFQKNPIVL